MADTLTLTKGADNVTAEEWIQNYLENNSPFFTAARRVNRDENGVYAIKRLVFEGNAGLVKEGERKPNVKMVWEHTQLPTMKAAFVTAATQEVVEDTPGFAENFRREAANKLLADINGYIFGTLEAPVGYGFQSFAGSNVAQVELVEGEELTSWRTAYQRLLGSGHTATDVITSNSTYGLVSLAPNAQGLYPLENATAWNGATVHRTNTLAEGAVVGDFSKAVFAPVSGIQIRVADTGTITLDDDTDVNLLTENKYGFVVELRFVWGITDESAFVRIVDSVDETP